ncbi:MAG: DUF6908 domain-containing protein [Nitrospira sp.]
MMNMYQAFATDLNHLLSSARAVRITVPEYMPLLVEEIGVTKDGHRLVSLCQYDEQHGDLMRDCDLVFMVTDLPDGVAAEPVSFQNDDQGIVQEVYRYDEADRQNIEPVRLTASSRERESCWFWHC